MARQIGAVSVCNDRHVALALFSGSSSALHCCNEEYVHGLWCLPFGGTGPEILLRQVINNNAYCWLSS
jgi:hypothetical protein